MNAFKLFGIIAVNNQDAIKAIKDTGNMADKLAAGMGKAFTKISKLAVNCGKVVAKGMAVGTAAMTGLVVKSMGLAGELEQNIGGAEAVFQQYADRMKKEAAEAYSTMGLSQAKYLATANKMGSLFKGAGFTTEEAANKTVKAMQRAADVASIMGIDLDSAMESIAGAAKGNFTMMDNLGVAINETTLANYALEKGITKSTAKMTTQEKVGLAMEMFLEKTADYAGNYAKENDTLAGSLTTAKAALQNFLSGAGDAKALGKALTGTGKIISKNLKKLLPHLVEGFKELMTGLTPELPELLRTTLPGIIEGAGEMMAGIANALPDLIDVIIDVLPETLQKLGKKAGQVWSKSVWPLIQDFFKFAFGIELPKWEKIKLDFGVLFQNLDIGEKARNVLSFIQDAFNWIGENKEFVKGALLAVGAAFLVVKAAVNPVGLALDALIAIIALVITNWEDVKTAVGNAVTAVGDFFGQTIPQAWKDMCSAIGNWWHDHITAPIQAAIDKLEEFLGLEGTEGDYVPGITGTGGNSAGRANSMYPGKGSRSTYLMSNPRSKHYVAGDDNLDHVPAYATGLDFVPYDNYLARLHYGETVLTRKDADAWRKGSTGNMAMLSAKFDQMQETFIQVLEGIRNQPVAINIDSKTAAVLMAKEMTKSIGNRNIQSLMGMGG